MALHPPADEGGEQHQEPKSDSDRDVDAKKVMNTRVDTTEPRNDPSVDRKSISPVDRGRLVPLEQYATSGMVWPRR